MKHSTNTTQPAVAALYTTNAILVTPLGIFSDQNAIEKYFTDVFGCWGATEQLWNAFHNCSVAPQHPVSTLQSFRSFNKNQLCLCLGGDLCAIGGWTVNGPQRGGGYSVSVYTPVRDTWKIRAAVVKFPTGP